MTTFAELFDPNHDYPYFSQASEHPFEAQNRHFSLVNAGWLADCSLLVYLRDKVDVETRLQRDGGRANEATGVSGDPRRASAERGEALLRLKVDAAVRQIRAAAGAVGS